jgi:hypothetical protein
VIAAVNPSAPRRSPLRRLLHALLLVLLSTVLLGFGLGRWQAWLRERAIDDVRLWLVEGGEPRQAVVTYNAAEAAMLQHIRQDAHAKRVAAARRLGTDARLTLCVGPEAQAWDVELEAQLHEIRILDVARGDRLLCRLPIDTVPR